MKPILKTVCAVACDILDEIATGFCVTLGGALALRALDVI